MKFERELEREALTLWSAERLFSRRFVRGKLRHDPVYVSILRRGLLPAEGTLLDIGCGRGVLFSAIVAARRLAERGAWPAGWPAPPRLALRGVDPDSELAEIAARALGVEARIDPLAASVLEIPAAAAATLIDVLHYLGTDEQERLLSRLASGLAPSATILVREADAAAGPRFSITRAAERLAAAARRRPARLAFRSCADWSAMLRALGFSVEVLPMSKGTPFANDLLVARR